jgi:hypothetical protein
MLELVEYVQTLMRLQKPAAALPAQYQQQSNHSQDHSTTISSSIHTARAYSQGHLQATSAKEHASYLTPAAANDG